MALTRSPVEVTLAVPVCWSARANNVMSACLQSAMRRAKFGTDGISLPLIFMVNEAEAAAMYALTSENVVLNVSAMPHVLRRHS